jgi:hypothetical protein
MGHKRMNISIPEHLHREMLAAIPDTNWSGVAATAFREACAKARRERTQVGPLGVEESLLPSGVDCC